MATQGQQGIQSPSVGQGRVPGLGELVAGKYRIERVLGLGGMGAVLSARHEQLGQVVALKVLHPAACESEESILRFMREAQSAASLESDHVVRIFDVGTLEDGVPFMVMERLLGEDLGNILEQRGPFPVHNAVECVYQATLGVADAHAAGIVHRDLKPSNLFLTRRRDSSAWVKVLDFGISKAISEADGDVHLTRTRTIVGSPLYMSPEQVRNSKQVDLRSDLWSLGVILHELLSGRPPFDGDTLPGVCARIAADPPTRLERTDVPLALLKVLDRCLQKDPRRRFGSALELSEALAPLRSPQSLPFGLFADERVALRDSAPRPRPSMNLSSPRSSGGPPTLMRSPPPLVGQSQESSLRSPVQTEPTLSSREPLLEGLPQTGSVSRPAVAEEAPVPPRRRGMLLALAALATLGLGIVVFLLRSDLRGGDLRGGEVLASAPDQNETPSDEAPAFRLRIDSSPEGADVWDGEQSRGRTPIELTIPAGGTEELRFELRREGYAPLELTQPPLARDVELRVQLSKAVEDEGEAEDAPGPLEPALAPSPPPAPTAVRRPSSRPVKKAAPVPPAPSASASTTNQDFGIRLER